MNTQTGLISEQARIASDANDLTKSIQRALVTVSELREETLTDQSGKKLWRYTPAIKNSGTTPATELNMVNVKPLDNSIVSGVSVMLMFDKLRERHDSDIPFQSPHEINERLNEIYWRIGPPDPEEILDWSPESSASLAITRNFILGPMATIYPFDASQEMHAEDALAAQRNAADFGRYFYGAIRYIDVFSPKQHITKYCFNIARWTSRLSGNTPSYSFCPHWNCVDETCEKDKKSYEADRAALDRKKEEERQKGIELERIRGRMHQQGQPQTPPAPQ